MLRGIDKSRHVNKQPHEKREVILSISGQKDETIMYVSFSDLNKEELICK